MVVPGDVLVPTTPSFEKTGLCFCPFNAVTSMMWSNTQPSSLVGSALLTYFRPSHVLPPNLKTEFLCYTNEDPCFFRQCILLTIKPAYKMQPDTIVEIRPDLFQPSPERRQRVVTTVKAVFQRVAYKTRSQQRARKPPRRVVAGRTLNVPREIGKQCSSSRMSASVSCRVYSWLCRSPAVQARGWLVGWGQCDGIVCCATLT